MDEQTVRKTYTYQVQPTAEPAGAMEFVLRRCRELYHAGLHERREAWQQCGVGSTAASQRAQLPAIKEGRPEYRDVHAQVWQDVLSRLDRAFQSFFRRVKAAETPGYPRVQGPNRSHSVTDKSVTDKQVGNGAT